MNECQRLAEYYASMGREVYEEKGVVPPLVAFHGERRLVAFLAPGEHPTDRVGQVVVALADVCKSRQICMAVEGWAKVFKDGESLPDNMQRGDLEKLSEVDAEVRTSIIGTAIDVKVPRESCVVSSIAMGDPRDVEWETTTTVGIPRGAMYDTVMAAVDRAPDNPAREMPLEWHLLALNALGIITEVILEVTDTDG